MKVEIFGILILSWFFFGGVSLDEARLQNWHVSSDSQGKFTGLALLPVTHFTIFGIFCFAYKNGKPLPIRYFWTLAAVSILALVIYSRIDFVYKG